MYKLTPQQISSITDVLNQARCLESKPVGNFELTRRLVKAIESSPESLPPSAPYELDETIAPAQVAPAMVVEQFASGAIEVLERNLPIGINKLYLHEPVQHLALQSAPSEHGPGLGRRGRQHGGR